MWDNPEGGELDPAKGVRKHCKKNSSILSCIKRWQEKAVTMATKSGQFTADKIGKGQFLWGNQRNPAGEEVVICLQKE